MAGVECEWCGARLKQKLVSERRKYCSDKHRVYASRWRKKVARAADLAAAEQAKHGPRLAKILAGEWTT